MESDVNLKIDFFRDKLHELICSEKLDSQTVIRLSQELDKLIVEYTKIKH